MANSEIENNILLNYDVFLIEQAIILDEIKKTIDEKVAEYETSYKAYYSHDLDKNNKIAYEKTLEEIETIKTKLNTMSELLEIFGVLTQRFIDEDLEILEIFKFENEELKALKNNAKNTGDASKPLKENYKHEYQTNFLTLFAKVIFVIIIFVIAYIQIKNRKL